MRDNKRLEDARIALSEKALCTISGRVRRNVEVRIQINPSHPTCFIHPVFFAVLDDAKGVDPDVVYPELERSSYRILEREGQILPWDIKPVFIDQVF
jgi:hypothetical protein